MRRKTLRILIDHIAEDGLRKFFDRDTRAEHKLQAIALKNGLAFYATLYGSRRGPALNRGLPLFIAPPLCITREEVDELLTRLDQTLTEWEKELGV